MIKQFDIGFIRKWFNDLIFDSEDNDSVISYLIHKAVILLADFWFIRKRFNDLMFDLKGNDSVILCLIY